MKNLKLNKRILRIVFSLFIAFNFISCDEEDSVTYDNVNSIDQNIGLSFNNISTYSFQETIVTDNPQFSIDGPVYKFLISEIRKDGAKLTTGLSVFSIDEKTGVIAIDNKNGVLTPGSSYNFDIGVGHVDGVILTANAFTLTVLEIPLSYTISNTTYDAKFLEVSDIATVTYEDTSTEGDVLADIVYSLNNPPAGFAINANSGVISKNTDATSGEHKISVIINSNLGSKTFTDVLTVTVGEAPILTYVQVDGTTPLTNVVLSPWTAYTSALPTMDGMNAVSYEIILPETLTAGSVVANNNGSISILTDQNLPIGVHLLGVIATNAAGITAPFNDVFTLTVETRWETTDLFNDTFDDDSTGPVDPGNILYPDFAGYTLGAINSWNKAVVAKTGKPTVRGLRVQNPDVNHHYIVRTIDVTGVKAMRVSFGEQWGYNDNFASVTYKRALYAGESTTDLESGIFNSNNWTEVMGKTDSRWPGSSTWGTRIANPIDNIDVDLSAISGATLKLAWYIGGDTAQNGQYLLDYCNAQVSLPFPAEEE